MSTRIQRGSIITTTSTLQGRRCVTPYPSQLRMAVCWQPVISSMKWRSSSSMKWRSSGAPGSGCYRSFSTPKASSNSSEPENSSSTEKPNINLLSHQHKETSTSKPTTLTTSIPSEPPRPQSNFPRGVWRDHFHQYAPEEEDDDDDIKRAHKQLKKQVRDELVNSANKKQQLNLINNIQRLGLEYLFESEIEEILQHVYETTSLSSSDDQDSHDKNGDVDDLYTVSLRFRLLRQQGFDYSADVFNKFTDVDGKLKESLIADIKGMLSLYEASFYGNPEGDEIIDQAQAFTINHLRSLVAPPAVEEETSVDSNINCSSSSSCSDDARLLAEIVSALTLPLLKSVTRVEAVRYIPVYEGDASHNKELLKLAKLDFNLLQSMHKQELGELSRWWNNIDTETKFPYGRSRLVENYLYSIGVKFEPQYQLARILSTKIYAIITLVDDMYDSYGTYEELQLFTTAVQRWGFECADELPENMKLMYRLILDTCEEIEQELATRLGESQRIHYLIRSIKGLTRGYFEEAKRLKEGHVPTMEEYMRNARLTSLYYFMPIAFVVSMPDDCVTDEALKWFENDTSMLVAGGIMCRLTNDICTHKREDHPTSVKIYMKEYNVSEKEAIDELNLQIDKAWKGHNEVIIRKPVPLILLSIILNTSRAVAFVYVNGGDGFTYVGRRTKEVVRKLFIDPVEM